MGESDSTQEPQIQETHEQYLLRDEREKLHKFLAGQLSEQQYLEGHVAERKRLEDLSEHDTLTNMLNRRGFTSRFEEMVERERKAGNSVSLLLLDIDYFKKLNDTKGHVKADDLLKYLARLLPRVGLAARWGGEEMVVAVANKEGLELEDVVSNLGRTIRQQTPVTASIGAATLQNNETAIELIARADKMMYMAKKERNQGYVDNGKTLVKVLFGQK